MELLEWDRLFNIDVKSIYLSTKYFVPDMIERKFGIRVNNVCPSACATPMFLTNQDPKVIELFEKASALGRFCTPEDIASAMYFLASDKSSFITGINLPVSGGMDIHTGQAIQEDR
ncbi:MAG: SDR family NAD(P)-dependent oxidoreductase [Cetobacterium sp.]